MIDASFPLYKEGGGGGAFLNVDAPEGERDGGGLREPREEEVVEEAVRPREDAPDPVSARLVWTNLAICV